MLNEFVVANVEWSLSSLPPPFKHVRNLSPKIVMTHSRHFFVFWWILDRRFLHTTVQVASFFPFSDPLPCFAPARVHTMIFLIQPISLRNNGFSNVFWSCEKLLTSSLTDRRGWSIITSHYSWFLAHLGQEKNIAHRAVSIRFIIKYQTSRTTKNLKERFFF